MSAENQPAAPDLTPILERADETEGGTPSVVGGPLAPARRVVVRNLGGVRPQAVRWLWPGLIPRGELTLLAGQGGDGKSTVSYDLLAKITTGTLDGEFRGKPQNVMIVSVEEDVEKVIVPRLMAAAADMSRVSILEVEANGLNIGSALDLSRDLPELEEAVEAHRPALLLIDPLMSRLGRQDTHRDNEVRDVLEPLVALAHRHDLTMLALIHLNKSGSTSPLQLVMGSAAFTTVPRSVLFLTPDPDDPDVRLLGQVKTNLGPLFKGTLRFSVVEYLLPNVIAEGNRGVVTSRAEWGDNDHRVIEQILREHRRKQDGRVKEHHAADDHAEWIEAFLSQEPEQKADRQKVLDAADAQESLTKQQVNSGSRVLRKRGRLVSEAARGNNNFVTWRLVDPVEVDEAESSG